MKDKYGKPQQFSDPNNDWQDSEETLREILEKQDEDLNLEDFSAIFSIWLPAADYHEGLYYIPLCFEQMMRKTDPIDTNISTCLLWYITYFRNRLEADGYYEECLQRIDKLARSYTETFELIRLSDAELEEYAIDPNYRIQAKYSKSVHALVDSLARYEEYWPILSDWIDSLAISGEAGSCWWIDIAHHVRWWHLLYRENDEANERKEEIINRLHRFGEYKKHWYVVSQLAASKRFYEYNRRVAIT